MKEFVRVIQIPTADGQRLSEYGLFHCIFFALTIAAMVFAVIYTLKKGEKNLYFLYVLSSVLMWVGELYKQFCYSFKTGTFHYDWYFFPWQFCSTPLYTFLFCAIAKKGKLYDAVSAYNATYALFAGTCVMLYPSTLVSNYGIRKFFGLLHIVRNRDNTELCNSRNYGAKSKYVLRFKDFPRQRQSFRDIPESLPVPDFPYRIYAFIYGVCRAYRARRVPRCKKEGGKTTCRE